MLAVGDIEAPSLEPDFIHCAILIDPKSGQMYEFHDRKDWALETSIWFPRDEFPRFIEKNVTNLVGHNFRGYDVPTLVRLYKMRYKGVVTDSLIWSRCLYPDRPKPEGYTGKDFHGLGSWGYRVGRGKPDHKEWEVFTPQMLHRCREDVEINVMTWRELLWEMFCRNTGKEFQEEWVWNPPEYPAWIRMEEVVASIIDKQERDGVYFDASAAEALLEILHSKMAEAEAQIVPNLPKIRKIKYVEKTFPESCIEEPFTKAGKLKAAIVNYYEDSIKYCKLDVNSEGDAYQVIHWLNTGLRARPRKVITERPMKIKSPEFKDWLMDECGWQPSEWNLKKVTKTEAEDPKSPFFKQQVGKPARDRQGRFVKASPKLTEDTYDTIQGGYGPIVKQYLVSSHRASMIEGLMEARRPDGTVGAGANSCGANTTRMKHRTVVNIPRIGSPYGEECRALFTARPGRVFVGYDASALEARMEAHYTYKYDDGAYAKEVLEGDIHVKNALAFGLLDDNLISSYRNLPSHDVNELDDVGRQIYYSFSCARNGGGPHGGGAKGAKYCLTYGGQAPKLAETLNKSKEQGNLLFEQFWEANESLRKFKEDCEREWEENGGWIQAIDGRWLKVRSKHSIVNLKFQSAGSIVCKTAVAILDKWVKRAKLDAFKVIDMHDEGQYDCSEADAPKLMALMEECVLAAGKFWGLNVPTPSESKMGKNWRDTH